MNHFSKVLISLFIVFNFFIMCRIHMPLNSRIFKSFYKPIDEYLSFFTLFQSWNMYSPNPLRTNAFLTAEVEFDDGTVDVYEFPRADRMDISEKYTHGERLRVMMESIRVDKNKFLWKDAAKFALRKLKKDNFYKIPLKVHLYRHWSNVPDPQIDFRPHHFVTQNHNSYKFYTYEVL